MHLSPGGAAREKASQKGIKTEPAVSRTDAAETSFLTSTGSGISIAKLYEAVKLALTMIPLPVIL